MRKQLCLCWIGLTLVVGCQTASGPLARVPSFGKSRVAKASMAGASDFEGVNRERMERARVLTESGRADEALFVYSQVLATEPQADAHHEMAIIHDKRGNFTESASHYDEALKLTPKNADLLCDRGYSYFLQGDFEQADRYLSMALNQQPGLPRAHNNMGMLLAQKGKIDSALGQFAAAGCTHAEARANLSYALMMSGEIDAARYQLELAKRSDQSLPATEQLQLAMHQMTGGATPQQQSVTEVARVAPKAMPAAAKPQPSVTPRVVAAKPASLSVKPAQVQPEAAALSESALRQQVLESLAATRKQPTVVVDAKQPSRDLAAALVDGPIDVDSPRRQKAVAKTQVAVQKSIAPVAKPAASTEVALKPTVHASSTSTEASVTPAAGTTPVDDANPLRDPTDFRFWR